MIPAPLEDAGTEQRHNSKSLQLHDSLPTAATLLMMSNSAWEGIYARDCGSVAGRPLPLMHECHQSPTPSPERRRSHSLGSGPSNVPQPPRPEGEADSPILRHLASGAQGEMLRNDHGPSPHEKLGNCVRAKSSGINCRDDTGLISANRAHSLHQLDELVGYDQPMKPEYDQLSIRTISEKRQCLCLFKAGADEILGRLPISYPIRSHIPRHTRAAVVPWMSRAVKNFGWPQSAFFIAVEAVDTYLWSSRSMPNQTRCSLPLLSTAALLLGVSIAGDTEQANQARAFVGRVPHVTSVSQLLSVMLDLATVGVSQNSREPSDPNESQTMKDESPTGCGLSVNCTPPDLLQLYLARMRDSESWKWLYYDLLESDRLASIIETVTTVAVYFYEIGGHLLVSPSRLIPVVLLLLLTADSTYLSTSDGAKSFARQVFELDFEQVVRPYLSYLYPLINQLASSPRAESNPLIRSLYRLSPSEVPFAGGHEYCHTDHSNAQQMPARLEAELVRTPPQRTKRVELDDRGSRRIYSGSTYAATISPDTDQVDELSYWDGVSIKADDA